MARANGQATGDQISSHRPVVGGECGAITVLVHADIFLSENASSSTSGPKLITYCYRGQMTYVQALDMYSVRPLPSSPFPVLVNRLCIWARMHKILRRKARFNLHSVLPTHLNIDQFLALGPRPIKYGSTFVPEKIIARKDE